MPNNESVVVFGFGAQGAAQALNLRDSRVRVIVSIPKDSKRKKLVEELGFELILDPKRAAQLAEVAAILIPDGAQAKFYKEVLDANLPQNATMVFAHGFALHYKEIIPRDDLDVCLVAPLAQGATLRSDYEEGRGVPIVVAVAKDATTKAKSRADAFARAISKGGPFIESTVSEEVEIDLFAEQAVLCGGLPELVRASFDTLVRAGYNREIAYFCCLKELRAIVRLMDEHCIEGMRMRISDTALFGALTRGPKVINEVVREGLGKVLEEIKSGEFADELKADQASGSPVLKQCAEQDRRHLIEFIHKKFNKE